MQGVCGQRREATCLSWAPERDRLLLPAGPAAIARIPYGCAPGDSTRRGPLRGRPRHSMPLDSGDKVCYRMSYDLR